MSAHSAFSLTSAFFFFLLDLLLFISPAAAAHRQHVLKPTTAASSATALASAGGYTYVGCWNETTGYKSNGGAGALEEGGKSFSQPQMTIPSCLSFCTSPKVPKSSLSSLTTTSVRQRHPMQYAALTLGRECHCGPQLSLLSEKLNDSERCIYSCDGNSSQVCGGAGALTLYNLTALKEELKEGRAWSLFSGATGYGTLAVVMLGVAAVL